MKIRLLTPIDAAAFQALRLQGLVECPSAFASSVEEERDTPLATIAGRLEPKDDRALFGAFDAQALVGVVGLQREGMRKLAHKAFVWGMYVAPQARRAGLGRELVAAALAFASNRLGVQRVSLGVNANNVAAIALYRSMGFEPFGLERGFMLLNGELHDEVHMVRVLWYGMPRNIEIKARIANFEALSRRARSLAGGPESRVRTTRGLLLAGAYLDLLAASSAGIACAR